MPSPNSHPILLLGLGELGTAILTALTAHPSPPPLTILLRPSSLTSPSPAKTAERAHLADLGVSTLPGDVATATRDELTALFKGFHTVIGATGMFAPPGTQTKIVEAVLEAGVERYLPWQFGVDYDSIGRGSKQDLFTEQVGVREILRGQGRTKWVVISTGLFLSFLFEPAFGVVVRGEDGRRTVRALGGWGERITVTAVRDIGRVVAEVVCGEDGEVEGVVFVAGETISYEHLAEVVEEVAGEKVQRELWSVERLVEELREDPEDGLKKYRVVFAEGRGVAWDVERTFNHRKGMGMQDVKGWALENLK